MRFPLTTVFVSPFYKAPILPHSRALCSTLPLCFFFFFLACPRSAFSSSSSSSLAVSFAMPSPPPSQQPLSRLSLSLFSRFCFRGHHNHVEVLPRPPPPPPLRPPSQHLSLSLWHFLLLPPRRLPPLKAISFSAFIQFFSIWLDFIFSGLYHCCVDSSPS